MTVRYKGALGRRPPPPSKAVYSDAIAASLNVNKKHRDLVRKKMEFEDGKKNLKNLQRELRGLKLLLDHYKLSDVDDQAVKYILLSLALARDHVPYFMPPKYAKPKKLQAWFPMLEKMIAELKRRRLRSGQAFEWLMDIPGIKSDRDSIEREFKKWRGNQKKLKPTAAI